MVRCVCEGLLDHYLCRYTYKIIHVDRFIIVFYGTIVIVINVTIRTIYSNKIK